MADLTVTSVESVNAVVNGGALTASVVFNSSESAPLTNLTITAGLSPLPAGWKGPATFACASVSTGSGCVLNLTYAPTALAKGTLTIDYGYTNSMGAAQASSVTINYQATTNNNVVATSAPAGQIVAIVGSGSQKMSVTFTTDDGNPASAFKLSTDLTSLPAGWSSTAHALSCASVSTGSGCQLSLSFDPTAFGTGSLALNYGYTDDFGVAKTGFLDIAYAGTVHDNVVGDALPTSVVSPVGNPKVDVLVTFTTDDGHPATKLLITSNLTALPAGWSSAASSFGCTSVSAGTSCQLPLGFTSAIGATGTLQLTYTYLDDAGSAKSGSVNIAYASTTHNTVVGTPVIPGTVRVAVGDSQPVAVTFNTDDGNVASNLTVSSGLTNLPAYWSGPGRFSCATLSTGAGCQITLTFRPLSSVSGTVTLGYGYTDSAGTAKTGTVSVPYAVKHVYVTDSNGVYVCSIVTGGGLSGCAPTALGRVNAGNGAITGAYGIAFADGYAFVNQYPDASVSVCAVNPSDGTLTACAVFAIPSGDYGYSVFATPGYLYIGDGTSDYCAIGANGTLSTCQSVSTGVTDYSAGIYVGAERAYVSPNGADVQNCTVTAGGNLTPCTDTGISGDSGGAVTASGNFVFLTPWSAPSVMSCPINASGSLGTCINSPVPGSNQGMNVATAVDTVNSYTINATDLEHCTVSITTGALTACAVSDGGAAFSGPSGVAIY